MEFVAQRARTVCDIYHQYENDLQYGQTISKVDEEALHVLVRVNIILKNFFVERMKQQYPELVFEGYYDVKIKAAQKLFTENRFE